jgi:ABC-2 type transport system permease protein
MRLSKAWLVATKDIRVFLRKGYAAFSLILFPLIVGIGLPFVVRIVANRQGSLAVARLPIIMDAFSVFFVIGAAVLPTLFAAYSLVGEKIEKSLEPLLAAPITDSELLLGKGIAAFLPSIGALYISAIAFMALTDLFSHNDLGYLYYPNWPIAQILLLLVPLTIIFAVEWGVVVSSRASDPRAAQMQSMFVTVPLLAVYIASLTGTISLDAKTLWIIAGVMLVLAIALFFLSIRTFQREEILTKWT